VWSSPTLAEGTNKLTSAQQVKGSESQTKLVEGPHEALLERLVAYSPFGVPVWLEPMCGVVVMGVTVVQCSMLWWCGGVAVRRCNEGAV
jgi:hypothetical protein